MGAFLVSGAVRVVQAFMGDRRSAGGIGMRHFRSTSLRAGEDWVFVDARAK